MTSAPGWLASLTGPWPAPVEVTAGAAVLITAVVCVGALRTRRRGPVTWAHLFAGAPVPWARGAATFAATVAVAAALSAVPALRWGWWPALGGWGTAVGGVHSALGQPGRFLVAAVACAVWLWAGPAIALAEERHWRGRPTRGRTHRCVRAVTFALLHLASGMPLAWALALLVPAAAFTATAEAETAAHGGRREAGVRAAAREHALFNAAAAALTLAVAAT